MKLVVKCFSLYMPKSFKKIQLRILLKMAAEVFNCAQPSIKGKSYEEALFLFASFTKEQAKMCLMDKENAIIVRQSLRDKSFYVGQRLRKVTRLSKPKDITMLLQLIYRNIGIELENGAYGNIRIHQCYFSDIYCASICSFISAMDEGIFAGLNQGGKLEFQKRMTKGSSCCQAYFYKER